jgi:hypothetical protein
VPDDPVAKGRSRSRRRFHLRDDFDEVLVRQRRFALVQLDDPATNTFAILVVLFGLKRLNFFLYIVTSHTLWIFFVFLIYLVKPSQQCKTNLEKC